MKNKLFFFFAFLLVLAGLERANANDIDTVWMRWMPHGHDVSSVRFSPDDSKIAAFSIENHAVAIVDVETGNTDKLINGFHSGEYTHDGQYILSFKGNLIYRINTSDYSQSTPFDTAMGIIKSISTSENGLAACKVANGYQIWDMNTGEIIYTKTYVYINPDTKTGESLQNIKISKEGSFITVLIRDVYENIKGEVYISKVRTEIINLSTFEVVDIINDIELQFISNSFKYIAGEYFIKGDIGKDEYLAVYDVEDKNIVFEKSGPNTIPDIAFSPDDKYMAVAYDHQYKLEIWDVTNKENVYQYKWDPKGPYWAVATSFNGNFIVAGTGRRIYLYKSYWSMVSVTDNTIQATITYPNPTQDIFNLEFDLIKDNLTKIDMIDLNGNIVKIIDDNFLLSGHQFYQVDITELPAGIYTLRINSGNFSYNTNIIKN
jgi:WD40 repeat protein